MRIAWSATAQADLEDLYDYIARDSPYYAEQFVDRLIESVGPLADHPRIGRRVAEAEEREDVRELLFRGYRVIYLVEADQVTILTVLHESRDLVRATSKPWKEG